MNERKSGYSMLTPQDLAWRESNMMKIPNTDLLTQLGGSPALTGRLWRMPPYSANTWHKHVEQWELYFVLEGTGRMRVGNETLTVPRHGAVLVAPAALRQVFNDKREETLWLIVGAPRDRSSERSDFYPEDPTSLPAELARRTWPPR